MGSQTFGARAPQSPEAELVEKRNMRRHRVLKSGVILFDKGFGCFDCQIRNMTNTGVMVQIDKAVGIPKKFNIKMGDGSIHPAKTIWRAFDRMGIQLEPVDTVANA